MKWLVALLSSTAALGAADLEGLKARFPDQYHSVAETPSGRTHYADEGLRHGKAVLLVHGVSGPLAVWDKSVPTLTEAGFRVIRFDLFGRGFSDRAPKYSHGFELYRRQLVELIEGLELKDSLSLVGSSFGAVLAADYAQTNPQRVRSLTLIGPAGFPIEVPTAAKLRDVPVLGDVLFWLMGKSIILKQNRKYFVDERVPEDFWKFFTAQVEVPGTAQAMRRTLAEPVVQNALAIYRNVGTQSYPVGVIWGRKDVTFPYVHHTTLLGLVPRAHLETIEDAGHIPQYERPTPVNEALKRMVR